MSRTQPYTGSPLRTDGKYLYIDGGALDTALSYYAPYFDDEELTVNWSSLLSGHERGYYYHALPRIKTENENDAQFSARVQALHDKFELIRKKSGWFVNYGVSIRRRKRGNEQKRVDTMIAVDMLTHAQRGLTTQASLLTNDQDFYPVTNAVMDFGVKTILICNQDKTNDEFLYSTDRFTELSLDKIHSWIDSHTRSLFPLPTNTSRLPSDPQYQNGGISVEYSQRINHPQKHLFEWKVKVPEFNHTCQHSSLERIIKYFEFKIPECDSLKTLTQELEKIRAIAIK